MTYYFAGLSYSPNDLAHHGIKGQKWGIRRFQNLDGTLTLAGKARYTKEHKYPEIHRNKRYQKAVLRDVDTSAMPRQTEMDRKKKEDIEYNILKIGADNNFYELSQRERDRYIMLDRLIREKSGDYYNDRPVSESFKKKADQIEKARSNEQKIEESYTVGKKEYDAAKRDFENGKLSREQFWKIEDKYYDDNANSLLNAWRSPEWKKNQKLITKLENDLAGIALRDIGYEDTKRARDLIYWYIFNE